jgi:integral membrane sensor domain MASE1
VAPLVLSWPGRAVRRGTPVEAIACSIALLVSGGLAFSPPILPGSTYPLAFLPFPALVWAALRFGPAGGARASVAVVTLAAVLTRRGGGLQPGPETLAMVWILLSVVGVTSLFGAALVAERDRATEERAEGERQLRQVIDLVPHFVFVKDRDGRFLLANRSMAEA